VTADMATLSIIVAAIFIAGLLRKSGNGAVPAR
jgi:hypothetical protein